MKVRLDEFNVEAGFQFRRQLASSPTGTIRVLQVKDLREGNNISWEDLVLIENDRDYTPYTIHPGDVLFLSRGHRLFASVVKEKLPNTIVPNYFFIIRPKPELAMPEYLAWYLNSPLGQARINLVHAGSHMPVVSKTDFLAVQIDVPPMDVQRLIVQTDNLARREEQLLADLISTRKQLAQQLCTQAALGRSRRK